MSRLKFSSAKPNPPGKPIAVFLPPEFEGPLTQSHYPFGVDRRVAHANQNNTGSFIRQKEDKQLLGPAIFFC